ncbi:MAG: hypothetical protein V4474_00525 [Patescibacteria group bacterium]
MSFFHRVADHLVPTHRNSYRPRLLHKHSLAFFLAAGLVAEAYFVAGIFGVNPAQPFLAAAVANAAPATDTANWALCTIAVVLAGLLAASLASHTQVRPMDLLLPGGVILGIVVLLLVLNAWYGGAYGIS